MATCWLIFIYLLALMALLALAPIWCENFTHSLRTALRLFLIYLCAMWFFNGIADSGSLPPERPDIHIHMSPISPHYHFDEGLAHISIMKCLTCTRTHSLTIQTDSNKVSSLWQIEIQIQIQGQCGTVYGMLWYGMVQIQIQILHALILVCSANCWLARTQL